MSQDHKKKVLLLAGLIVLLCFFLPIFLSEPRVIKDQSGGSYWRNIIFDFQSLITGALAVLAAAYTIRFSMIFDQRQQKRHDEMMAFTMRRELQTLERAFYPQVDDFMNIVDRRLQLIQFQNGDIAENALAWFSNICAFHQSDLLALREIVERQQFNDGLPLFNGRLSRALIDFKKRCDLLLGQMQTHMNDGNVASWEQRKDQVSYTAFMFASETRMLKAQLLFAQLEYIRLAERFRH